ncbi:MAG: T9SS type A sorting domain-containing protein [Aquaticitalea sp.]
MSQNPLDGSVIYTNIFTGTIKRFSFFDSSLNVNDNETATIRLFPNPIKNQLNISGIDGDFQLQVYNLSGQLLVSGTLHGHSVMPISLSSGIYITKIAVASGQTFVKKMIVE